MARFVQHDIVVNDFKGRYLHESLQIGVAVMLSLAIKKKT